MFGRYHSGDAGWQATISWSRTFYSAILTGASADKKQTANK